MGLLLKSYFYFEVVVAFGAFYVVFAFFDGKPYYRLAGFAGAVALFADIPYP